MIYTQVTFENITDEQQQVLAAMLEELGYEGFEFETDVLKAFIPSPQFDAHAIQHLLSSLEGFGDVHFQTESIPETNWNAVWESGYKPLHIKGGLYLRATFHEPDPTASIEVIIDPKMSFGTGHHDTTRMMAEMLMENPPEGKSVLDFGSGTGVLAILAAKLGAESVLAIDHEEWAWRNSLENIALNGTSQVTSIQGDERSIPSTTFDIVLANVNKNVIIATLHRLVESTKPNGFIYLSGLLHEDEDAVLNEAQTKGLNLLEKKTGNQWICLKLTKAAA